MDVFLQSLIAVVQWPTVALMLAGAFIGFWVGILPGLGGAVTLALMMPFVFTMQPISAFAFLLGMHSVCAMCGDVTSILFAIPGETTSAATILDGFPMSQKGQASRALGAVLMSSLIGAWLGAFALAAIIPVVRPLVLSFGAPEFLVLAILGLSFVVSLSTKSFTKGILMAGIGFFFSAVGTDPQGGIPRYVFGQLYLWEGINIVPVTVGIFAIPEILELMLSGESIAKTGGKAEVSWAGVWEGALDAFRHWFLVVRCSLLGMFLGLIPGMGGSVAQWIAYAHAQQTSKNPEEFGTGRVEGVLSVGAAQNAKEGGSLIPCVAFGIPAGAAMAILLGAFLIVGLTPGPEMLKEHLDVTFSMVWTIVLAHLFAVVLTLVLVRRLAALTFMNGRLLAPFLLVLVAVGAYTANNSLMDIVVMLAVGFLGVVCMRFDWPRPPLVLALVLGEIAERNLWLSYRLSGFAWLERPSVIVILLIAIGGTVVPPLLAMRSRRRAARLSTAE